MITRDDPFQQKSTNYRELWVLLAIAIFILLLCYVMGGFAFFSLDEGIGVYHVTTSVADLDGDGDQDVVVGKARWEAESTSWTGLSLWFNLGKGFFTRDEQDRAGPFTSDAGDLDGDGNIDLAILDGYILRFLLNEGEATGGRVVAYRHFLSASLPVGPGHSDTGGSVVLGDLNRDGALDGFVAGCCYLDGGKEAGVAGLNPSRSYVWINAWNAKDGPRSRLLHLAELDGLPILGAAMGDLDQDGDLDIYAAVGTLISKAGKRLADRILLNDGQGNLSSSSQNLSEENSSSVALGDLDNDGDLDALVGNERGAQVLLNQGGAQGGQVGSFATSGQPIPGKPASAVFLADMDGDNDQDALIAGLRQAVIWWNDGQGVFTRSDQRFSYTKRHGLALADFTGDSLPDIFAGAYLDSYLAWINQGDGTFRAWQPR
jgi:hypothetical protein